MCICKVFDQSGIGVNMHSLDQSGVGVYMNSLD